MTASAPLLARVSGLNATLAKNIVDYRDANGPFACRNAVKKVPRLGEKTFEQAAGFLRIISDKHPLDRSAVHPEVGVKPDQFTLIANHAMHDSWLHTNPRKIDGPPAVRELLDAAW